MLGFLINHPGRWTSEPGSCASFLNIDRVVLATPDATIQETDHCIYLRTAYGQQPSKTPSFISSSMPCKEPSGVRDDTTSEEALGNYILVYYIPKLHEFSTCRKMTLIRVTTAVIAGLALLSRESNTANELLQGHSGCGDKKTCDGDDRNFAYHSPSGLEFHLGDEKKTNFGRRITNTFVCCVRHPADKTETYRHVDIPNHAKLVADVDEWGREHAIERIHIPSPDDGRTPYKDERSPILHQPHCSTGVINVDVVIVARYSSYSQVSKVGTRR